MRRAMLSAVLVCLFGSAVLAPQAHAFGMSGYGGKLGYMSLEDSDGALAIAGHLEFEQAGSRLHLLPSIMYWNGDQLSNLSLNADGYYHFYPEGAVTPYLGAGLGLNMFDREGGSSDTELGANLIGGLRIPSNAAHFFFEGRYTISEISQFGLLGGVTFHR